MTPMNKIADRLLRLLVPKAEASAGWCDGLNVCERATHELYCCTDRGCYRNGWC